MYALVTSLAPAYGAFVATNIAAEGLQVSALLPVGPRIAIAGLALAGVLVSTSLSGESWMKGVSPLVEKSLGVAIAVAAGASLMSGQFGEASIQGALMVGATAGVGAYVVEYALAMYSMSGGVVSAPGKSY
jgi:hypothetical protein